VTAMPALLAALIIVAWFGYVPVRLSTLSKSSVDVLAPLDFVERANVGRAVVFAPRPFGLPCTSFPTHNYIFFRPNNDPDLQNDVLWVNHLDVASDRQLMRHFPGRKGLILHRNDACELSLVPVETADPRQIPAAIDPLKERYLETL